MRKFLSIISGFMFAGFAVSATAAEMAPATVVIGPENGKEYLVAQPTLTLTWGNAELSFADETLTPSITIYQKGYEDDPDSYTFGTGTYAIVDYNGGTNNALELDLSGYTSKLDYTTFQRVIKLGEYVIGIKEGFLQNAAGDLNPQQTITFKQVDELTPATYMAPATVAAGPEDGKEYLVAQPTLTLTWGNAELSFADQTLTPSITIYQKGYEDDPDSYTFGTGTYAIVDYNGGTNNALELDLSGYTSKLDYTTFQRVIKLGEYVIGIKEGFLQNAAGDLNPQQTITFKQVDELTPATYMDPGTVVEGPENGKEYLVAQPTLTLTWNNATLSFADQTLTPSITIYQKGYEDDPDSYTFGTGTYAIVDYDGGTNNALELDLSGYTSKLDYTTFQRVIKLGEYVINIKEGFLQNAAGDINPQQSIVFNQVDELTPATVMAPATVVVGPEDGKEYLEAQPTLILSWDNATLSFADEALTPSITIYQKGYEDDPDSYTFGTGTYTIVDYNGGTNNALELDLSGYTSRLDYTTFQRVIKLGEYVIGIKEGFLQNADGDLNPQQTIAFKQVDEITPATYMEPATVVVGPENDGEYLDAQPTLILTWDNAELSFANESLTPSITIYQKGYEDDPDSYTFGTGTYAIVDYAGGTNNALELDLSGYTSKLDYTTFQRVIKLGQYVIGIKEGFLQNAAGAINPQQTITFTQTDKLSGIGVTLTNDEVIYYDLSGKQIGTPEKGKIVIRVSNGKTEKIVK